METCCGYGYAQARALCRPEDFHGASGAHRTPPRCGALPAVRPSLRTNRFQGARPLSRKENSARGPRRRLLLPLRCREESASWCRNVDRLPFRRAAPEGARSRGATLRLRGDSPMSNCCSHGTLPHFSPQRSQLSICYYLYAPLSAWVLSYYTPKKKGGGILGRHLPPRSAPGAVRPGVTPRASSRAPAHAYSPGRRSCPGGAVWVARLSAIHFQG